MGLCQTCGKNTPVSHVDKKNNSTPTIKSLEASNTKLEKLNNQPTKQTSNQLTPRRTTILGENELLVNSELIVGCTSGSPMEYYKIIDKLGEGSYGLVWKVKHHETGLFRAMKKIIKNEKTKKDTEKEILNEIGILKKMDHPSIVKIFEFFNSKDGYFLITEFCNGGELFNELKHKGPFCEKIAANIMYQVFSAINYCHKSNNIIHRDLKLENILIESTDEATGFYNIKVIDFGTAKIYERNKNENKIIGSSYYIAPEVLSKNYNEKCDLWSCGVILFMLLSGKPPFAGEKDPEILQKIKQGKYDIEHKPFDTVSSDAKNLIKKLLTMNPNKRISAADALKHSWFKKHDTRKYFCNVTDEYFKTTVNNLLKYNPTNKLQQVVLAYLVHNLPDIDEIKMINKVFAMLNINSDGKLTKEEFMKGLGKHLSSGKSKKEIKEDVENIFRIIDNDNNGYIEFEEFARGGLSKEIFMDEEVLQFAFNFLDKDHSKEITLEAIKEVFCVGKSSEDTDQLLKEIISSIDLDGNGKIDFAEFQEMMRSILK